MQWYELYDVSERYHTLINPLSEWKVLELGEVAGMQKGTRVIDFGCGFAEPLVLWAERFGIRALGIEFRPYACRRARERIEQKGLAEQIEIVETRGEEYEAAPGSFDIGVCLGASFIWNGFRPTIQALRKTVRKGGRLIIGEVFWNLSNIPPDHALREKYHCEHELVEIAGEEGYSMEYVRHSSRDDWDTYEAKNWRSLRAWLRENPDHEDFRQVADWLRQQQIEYTRFNREYQGWGAYVLDPI